MQFITNIKIRIAEFFFGWAKKLALGHYNILFHRVITDAYTRGRINSNIMHELCGEWNRQNWPERHAEAKGRVYSNAKRRFVTAEELAAEGKQ